MHLKNTTTSYDVHIRKLKRKFQMDSTIRSTTQKRPRKENEYNDEFLSEKVHRFFVVYSIENHKQVVCCAALSCVVLGCAI